MSDSPTQEPGQHAVSWLLIPYLDAVNAVVRGTDPWRDVRPELLWVSRSFLRLCMEDDHMDLRDALVLLNNVLRRRGYDYRPGPHDWDVADDVDRVGVQAVI